MGNGDEGYWRGTVDQRLEGIEKDVDEIKKDVKAIRKNGAGNNCGDKNWYKHPVVMGSGSGGFVVAIIKIIEAFSQ